MDRGAWQATFHGIAKELNTTLATKQPQTQRQFTLGAQPRGPSLQTDPVHPCRYFNCSSPGVQACSLPASCCIDPWEGGASVNDQCGFGALGLDEDAAQRVVYLEGCSPPLLRWLHSNIRTLGCYTIGVVLVQGVELLLAIQLVRALTVHKGAAGSGGLSIGTPSVLPSAKLVVG